VFVAVQSTLISLYPLAAMAAYYVVRKLAARVEWRAELLFVIVLAVPHLCLLLIMVQQSTLSDFIDQAFVFNQQHYAHYDIGGDPLTILRNAVGEFAGLIGNYLKPANWRDVETVLLVSNLVAPLLLWRRRGRLFAAFYLAVVFLSRMRGPGYHGAPYFVVSFVSLALVLGFAADALWRVARERLLPGGSARARSGTVQQVLVVAAALGWIGFVGVFYHDIGGFVLRLPRGEGLQSPYSESVAVASGPTDRIWVAPLDPSVYLETGRSPASRYTFYHPWLAESPEITAAVLHDLQTNRPAVIVFEADKRIDWLFPLPTPAEYGATVFAYIQQQYAPLDPRDPVLRNVFVRRDRGQQ
jgi:hypothetical protein